MSKVKCTGMEKKMIGSAVCQTKTDLKFYNNQLVNLVIAQLLDRDITQAKPKQYFVDISNSKDFEFEDLTKEFESSTLNQIRLNVYPLINTNASVANSALAPFTLSIVDKNNNRLYHSQLTQNRVVAIHFESEKDSKQATYWIKWTGAKPIQNIKLQDEWIVNSPDVKWFLFLLENKDQTVDSATGEQKQKVLCEVEQKIAMDTWVAYDLTGVNHTNCILLLIYSGDIQSIHKINLDQSVVLK